jgi:hypothetical protein
MSISATRWDLLVTPADGPKKIIISLSGLLTWLYERIFLLVNTFLFKGTFLLTKQTIIFIRMIQLKANGFSVHKYPL